MRTRIRSLSRLPSRQVLYGQLVGVVASPVSGLVRSLNNLLAGLAVALSQVQEKKESGEIPSPASPEPPPAAEPEAEAAPAAEPEVEAGDAGEAPPEDKAEPAQDGPDEDNQADVSAEAESDDAETKPTKED